jgi:hypothetical protein
MKVRDILSTLLKRLKELWKSFLNEEVVVSPPPTPEKPAEPVVEPQKPNTDPLSPVGVVNLPKPPVVETPPVVDKPKPVDPPKPVEPPPPPPTEEPVYKGYNGKPEGGSVWDQTFKHYTYYMRDGQPRTFEVVVPAGKTGFQILSMHTPILGYAEKEEQDYIESSIPGYGRMSIGSGRWDVKTTGKYTVTFTTHGWTGGVNFNILWKDF